MYSLVVHFVRDEGVAGSNPVIPTILKQRLESRFCLYVRGMTD